MKGVVIMAVMVALAMVVLAVEPGLAISCGQVDSALSPCISYLMNGGNPAQACCTGVKSLETMIQTPEDRRAACDCIKQAASHYQNIKEDAVSNLPAKCGVEVGVPISKNVDCTKIS